MCRPVVTDLTSRRRHTRFGVAQCCAGCLRCGDATDVTAIDTRTSLLDVVQWAAPVYHNRWCAWSQMSMVYRVRQAGRHGDKKCVPSIVPRSLRASSARWPLKRPWRFGRACASHGAMVSVTSDHDTHQLQVLAVVDWYTHSASCPIREVLAKSEVSGCPSSATSMHHKKSASSVPTKGFREGSASLTAPNVMDPPRCTATCRLLSSSAATSR